MRALSPRRLLPLLLAPALAAACGGEGGPGASAGGTGGGDAGAELHALPPAPAPGAKAPDGAGSATFAVRRLYLGDTARDGTPDLAEGWRSYGFDLDGKISSASSADLCRPLHGASKEQVYPDGELGIDNAFGKRIVPILRGVDAELSQKIDQALLAGGRTSLFTLDQLGEGPDQGPISARFYLGAALDHPPSFDGSDVWPVRARSLADAADLGSATVTFPESYLVGDVWVGHAQGDLPVSVRLSPGVDLVLPLSHAVVVMKLDPDHRGATQGTIAGIVATAALTQALTQASIDFDPSLCVDLTQALTQASIDFDPSLCVEPPSGGLIAQLEQASDILLDGPQDPAKSCDGLSLGLGFDAARVSLGAVVPEPPPAMPCGGPPP